jgi:hypothetical protein
MGRDGVRFTRVEDDALDQRWIERVRLITVDEGDLP